MRYGRLFVLGACLIVPMVVTGCGSSSSTIDGGNAGATGGGGAGGAATDASVDHGSPADATDVHAETGTDVATDTATDVPHDAPAADTGPMDAGTDSGVNCTGAVGPGNMLLYAFNGGVNAGWSQFVKFDNANSGLTTSLGASFTDGHLCPGALLLGVNFTDYGPPASAHGESAATEHFYADSPGGQNWSAYKALHAWIKVQTVDPLALLGVYFYLYSGPAMSYASAFGATADLTDWHEVVINLTGATVVPNDITKFGFEVVLKNAPPAGAPANPSQVILLADYIWLEGFPPDGGTGDGGDAGSGQ
jgi:hypothetical protein